MYTYIHLNKWVVEAILHFTIKRIHIVSTAFIIPSPFHFHLNILQNILLQTSMYLQKKHIKKLMSFR